MYAALRAIKCSTPLRRRHPGLHTLRWEHVRSEITQGMIKGTTLSVLNPWKTGRSMSGKCSQAGIPTAINRDVRYVIDGTWQHVKEFEHDTTCISLTHFFAQPHLNCWVSPERVWRILF